MIFEVIKKTIELHLHLDDVVIKSIHISEADLEVLKKETENINCFGYPIIKDESTYIEIERRY